MSTHTRLDRAAFPALLLLIAAACASTAGRDETPNPGVDISVERIAEDLTAAAELRTDLSSMRVGVQPLEGRAANSAARRNRAASDVEIASLGAALDHELTQALSERLYLLDSSQGDAVVELGATHALSGSFVRRDADLLVSLRLVDVGTKVIVASARGSVPYDSFVARGALAWVESLPSTEPASEAVEPVLRQAPNTTSTPLDFPRVADANPENAELAELADPDAANFVVTPEGALPIGPDGEPLTAALDPATIPPSEGPASIRLRRYGTEDEK